MPRQWWKLIPVIAIAVPSFGMAFLLLVGGPRAEPASPSPTQAPAAARQQARPTTAVIIGDSYVAGGGDVSRPHTYTDVVCDQMGWACNVDAQGGTGYVADGHANYDYFAPYIDRLGTTAKKYTGDYIIVTGGRNDIGAPGVEKAVRRYLRALHGSYPDARIIVVAPFWNQEPPPGTLTTVREATKGAAAMIHADWVNTTGWLTPDLMGPDNVHPTKEGHAELARRLIGWLRAHGIKPDPSLVR